MNSSFLRLHGRAGVSTAAAPEGHPQQKQKALNKPVSSPRTNINYKRGSHSAGKVSLLDSATTDLQPVQLNDTKNFNSSIFSATEPADPRGAAGEVAIKLIISKTVIETRKLLKKWDSAVKLAAVLLCDALERAVVQVSRLRSDDKPVNWADLWGNYAPVESEFGPSVPLVVVGTLPACLNGEFLRVGPNPKFEPQGNFSWFDGDGMMHGLRIKEGQVSYTARYVRTSRLSQEENYGAAKFLRMADCSGRIGLLWVMLHALRVWLGVLDVSNGWGSANVSLVFHNRELLSLHEIDKPYSIRVHDDGDLETLGQVSYDRKLNHPFTAHPKVDPVTGEMFVLGCNLGGKKPFVTYRVVSKGGEMREPVAITTSGLEPPIMHDFAITEKYAIILDCPLHVNPMNMLLNRGLLFVDKTKPARFGILPRYAENESLIKWFELPTCYVLHTANAWDEGEEVVLIGIRSLSFSIEYLDKLIIDNGDKTVEPGCLGDLYEFRFNLKTGEASEKQLSDFPVEFPAINLLRQGRKSRYVYTTIGLKSQNIIKGLAKFDLTKEPELVKGKLQCQGSERNLAGVFWLGEGIGGSEAVFVPSGAGLEEDEGYLVFYSHDENKGQSKAIVIDARTMSADPVAVIDFPTRVPYGIHGLFIPEQNLIEQPNFL